MKNVLKNNFWIIVILIFMWVLGSINTLKFSEISVQNAEKNLNDVLGSYLFLAGQLQSLEHATFSNTEKEFLSTSKQLTFEKQWRLNQTDAYLKLIDATERDISNHASSLDQVIKKKMFEDRHTELLVMVQTYNKTVIAHNQRLQRFPFRYLMRLTHSELHQTIYLPSVVEEMPVISMRQAQ